MIGRLGTKRLSSQPAPVFVGGDEAGVTMVKQNAFIVFPEQKPHHILHRPGWPTWLVLLSPFQPAEVRLEPPTMLSLVEVAFY